MGARRALNVAYAAVIEGATWEKREEFDEELAVSFDEAYGQRDEKDRRYVIQHISDFGGEIG